MIITITEPGELKLIEEITGGRAWAGKIIITGVGILNTINALKDIPRSATILNLGYAGSNTLEKGKCYQVSASFTHHSKASFREDPIWLDQYFMDRDAYPCYTATDFVEQTEVDHPALFDMELAAIASMGFNKVMSIKKVSDSLNYEQYKKEAE